VASSVLAFSLLVACNHPEVNSSTQEQKPSEVTSFPKNDHMDSIVIDAVNEDKSIRAEQQTEQGTLLMISNGREELGHLVISSTMGQEGDQTFQSNYSIIFRQGDQEKVLIELPNYLFFRPSSKKLSFEKLSFKEADVYILSPQYQTGHGVEGYIFAINKQSEDVFPLEIVKKNQVSNTLLYSEAEPLPSVENDTLVVHPPVGAGTPEEDAKDIFYKLELNNKRLVAE
jgi:hypothetical protein